MCASTPTVTRSSTGATAPRSAATVGQPVDLGQRVDHDAADAGVDRALQLGAGLVVAVQPDRGRVEPRPQGDGELGAGAGVEPQALLRHPARHLGAQERLAGVVDVGAAAQVRERRVEGRREIPRAGTEVVLVEHVDRRAVVAGDLPDVEPGDGQRPVRSPLDPRGPQVRHQPVRVGRDGEPGRRAVPLGVQGTGLVRPHVTSGPAPRRRTASGRSRAPGAWPRPARAGCGGCR